MANEIHSLKIGNTEYPIYSEGLKIDDHVSGSAFLVVDGPDNRKVGTSTAIFGDSTSLTLASSTINIGNGYEGYEPTVIIGDNAGMLYIGGGSTNPVTIHIGAGNDGQAPSNIKMGTSDGSIEIGYDANTVDIGECVHTLTIGKDSGSIDMGSNSDVKIGESSTVNIGYYGSTIDVGEYAEAVSVGNATSAVNIGNQCEGNVTIGDGSVWTYDDEDGNEIVEKTTNTYIGQNNNEINIGNNSNITTIGSTNNLVNIGNNSNTIVFGGFSNSLNIGPSCNSLYIGSTTTSDMSIVTGTGDNEAIIEFDDTDGLYSSSQKINIKSTETDAHSRLVLNGAEVDLSSTYSDGSSFESRIYATDEELQITQLNSTDTASIFMSGYDDTQDCSVIDLKATYISIGHSDDYNTGVPYVYIGKNAEGVNIGTNGSFIDIGYNSGNVLVGGYNLTIGDTGTNNATDNIKINADNYIDIDSGLYMDVKAAGWIKNRTEAFFIGDTINGVPTDEYLEGCTHEVYINAFSDVAGVTTAPISIKSGATPRVITTTLVDGTSATNNMTSYNGLSSLTNVEIGKEFNIKNDIISANFFPSSIEQSGNAATLSVGNKLKDSYNDTWVNVATNAISDAVGVISMRVNDVYEINNDADVHSTIELTPLDYKSLCKWVDSDGEFTYQSYMNMFSCSDTDNIVIGSKYMYDDDVDAQHDIKISNDNFTGIQLYGNYYDGESTASLDMNYNGIILSYDYPPDATESSINMSWSALSLSYNNDSYGGNELISLGTDGTTIMSTNLKVDVTNLQMPVPIGDGTTGNYGIKLFHPNSNGAMGTIIYSASSSQYIAPITAYSAGSNINLGTSAKRFGTIYVNAGYATTSFTSSSDERLKDFGENIDVDLDALAALRKSYYRWNEASGFENEKNRMLGMSAQEVQKIYPEVVNTDDEGMLSMAYDRLSVVALAAIDKLHETNKELKAENDELKDRITKLENLVDVILSRIN